MERRDVGSYLLAKQNSTNMAQRRKLPYPCGTHYKCSMLTMLIMHKLKKNYKKSRNINFDQSDLLAINVAIC